MDKSQKRIEWGYAKINTSMNDLTRDLPPQFSKFMNYVKNLKFDENPDYNYCRYLFTDKKD